MKPRSLVTSVAVALLLLLGAGMLYVLMRRPAAAPEATRAKAETPAATKSVEPPAGWIVGTVHGANGIPAPGATVRVTTPAGSQEATADAEGRFAIRAPLGPFRISAVVPGFGLTEESGTVRASAPEMVHLGGDAIDAVRALSEKNAQLHAINRALEKQRKIYTAEPQVQPSPSQAPEVAEAAPLLPSMAEPPIEPAEAESMPPVARTEDEPCNEPDQPCRVRVYFGTDRNVVRDRRAMPAKVRYLSTWFGPNRSQDGVTYGECLVHIPKDYPKLSGNLDYKGTYVPGKAIYLEDVRVTSDREQWLANVRNRVAQDPGREMLVFVHGFNVSFVDAARRTAQIHYDLGFKGAPVFFSWPSRQSLVRYWADEAAVETSTPHLRAFLEDLATRTGAQRIHIIAHSMGSRALTRALSEIGEKNRAAIAEGCGTGVARFSEVFLAAPDLDTELFKQLQGAMQDAADRVTLYASNRDRAIRVSRLLHLYPRLGEPLAQWDVEEVTAVDASNASSDFLGHSYYGGSILADVRIALAHPELPVHERCTIRQPKARGYYGFKPQVDPVSRWTRMWRFVTGSRSRHRDQLASECRSTEESYASRSGGE